MSANTNSNADIERRRTSDSTASEWFRFLIPLALAGIGVYVALVVGPLDKTLEETRVLVQRTHQSSIGLESKVGDMSRRLNELETTSKEVSGLLTRMQAHGEADSGVHQDLYSRIKEIHGQHVALEKEIEVFRRDHDRFVIEERTHHRAHGHDTAISPPNPQHRRR